MDSISKIRNYIEDNLSEKRKLHTYGVRDTALILAEQYGCDREKAEIAALSHDLYRSVPEKVLNYHITHMGLPKRYLNNANLAHSKIAALMIQREFGIDDRDIINAVSFHTTGRAGMSLLEKIIYISDATEPGRSYPGVEALRRLVKEDIDKACLISLANTIDYIKSGNGFLDNDTVKAKDYFEKLIEKRGESK